MPRASLTLAPPDGYRFDFDALKTDAGSVFDQLEIQEEDLRTPGVDGERFRTIFKQYRPFQAVACSGAGSIGIAEELKARCLLAKGSRGKLKVQIGNIQLDIPVKVRDCLPRIGQGPYIGESSSPAWIITTWTFVHYPVE
jgi:hypothetical protein